MSFQEDLDEQRIEAVLREEVESLLPDLDGYKVLVRPRTDEDGDRFIEATVVLLAADKLESEAVMALVRRFRARLTAMHVEEFPLVNILSKADAAKMAKFARETA